MRVKVAECAALFWDDGKLVWDGFLDQRQHALTPDAEVLLRWFAGWRELDSATELGDRPLGDRARLLDAGVLVAEGSEAHAASRTILRERWGEWGASARHFHFATRTPAGQRHLNPSSDVEAMREYAAVNPPPAIATSDPERALVPLPGADAGWACPTLSTRCGRGARCASSPTQPVALE